MDKLPRFKDVTLEYKIETMQAAVGGSKIELCSYINPHLGFTDVIDGITILSLFLITIYLYDECYSHKLYIFLPSMLKSPFKLSFFGCIIIS